MKASTPKPGPKPSDRCPRCGGMMVRLDLHDWAQDRGPMDVAALRCMSCGEIIDPLILAHRQGRAHREDRGGDGGVPHRVVGHG